MRVILLLCMFFLSGCADVNRFVEVVNVDKNSGAIEFEFTPKGQTQISFILRSSMDNKKRSFAANVKVLFEDSTYYQEIVEIPIFKNGEPAGTQHGNVIDIKYGWRKDVVFQKNGNVKIVIKPAFKSIDWEGLAYFGVEVDNARKKL